MRREEDSLQIMCVKWFDMQYPEYRLLLHHSPNGSNKSKAAAGIFKAMGERAGFPDLILLLPGQGYTALAVEMKTATGRQSPAQKEWQAVATENGIRYEIVRDIDTFISLINEYVKPWTRHC